MTRTQTHLAAIMLILPTALALAAQPPAPTLGATLSPESQSVDAAYADQDLVFAGQLSLGNAPYAKYEVFLDSSSSTTWATYCSPVHLIFWGEGSAMFNVTVRVPRLATGLTARVWVESRVTYEDVDVAGNISGSVYVSVGKLPPNPGLNGTGDPFFGDVSGGGSALPYVVVALSAVVPVVVAVALVFRRKKRLKRGNIGNHGQ